MKPKKQEVEDARSAGKTRRTIVEAFQVFRDGLSILPIWLLYNTSFN